MELLDEEVQERIGEQLYSRAGKAGMRNSLRRRRVQELRTQSDSPNKETFATVQEMGFGGSFGLQTEQKSKGEPLPTFTRRRHSTKQRCVPSFQAVSREKRERSLGDRGKKPCVGQYTPNYGAVSG